MPPTTLGLRVAKTFDWLLWGFFCTQNTQLQLHVLRGLVSIFHDMRPHASCVVWSQLFHLKYVWHHTEPEIQEQLAKEKSGVLLFASNPLGQELMNMCQSPSSGLGRSGILHPMQQTSADALVSSFGNISEKATCAVGQPPYSKRQAFLHKLQLLPADCMSWETHQIHCSLLCSWLFIVSSRLPSRVIQAYTVNFKESGSARTTPSPHTSTRPHRHTHYLIHQHSLRIPTPISWAWLTVHYRWNPCLQQCSHSKGPHHCSPVNTQLWVC